MAINTEHLTVVQENQIVSSYIEGEWVSAIADRFHVSRQSIYNVLDRMGISRRDDRRSVLDESGNQADETILSRLSDAVKATRLGMGMTQAEFAAHCGLRSAMSVSNIENGRSEPSFRTIFRIIHATEIDPASLFLRGKVQPRENREGTKGPLRKVLRRETAGEYEVDVLDCGHRVESRAKHYRLNRPGSHRICPLCRPAQPHSCCGRPCHSPYCPRCGNKVQSHSEEIKAHA